MMKKIVLVLILSIFSSLAYADEVKCLAKNIFYEAQNQPVYGMLAIADVTLNRVNDPRWPSTVCAVVEQRRWIRKRLICQFSWFCDGKSDSPKPEAIEAFSLSYMLATVRLQHRDMSVLPADIYWYHNDTVQPYWASAYRLYTTIGDHTFYSDI